MEDTIFFPSGFLPIEFEEETISEKVQTVANIMPEKVYQPQNLRKERTHLNLRWDHGYVN